tara:strand:+ start:14664 stop:14903 length:240 start_codon:yes stop_codon:yes gene_type:complete
MIEDMRILPKPGVTVWMRSGANRPLKATIKDIDEWHIALHFSNGQYNDPNSAEFGMNKERILYHRAFWESLIRIEHGRS